MTTFYGISCIAFTYPWQHGFSESAIGIKLWHKRTYIQNKLFTNLGWLWYQPIPVSVNNHSSYIHQRCQMTRNVMDRQTDTFYNISLTSSLTSMYIKWSSWVSVVGSGVLWTFLVRPPTAAVWQKCVWGKISSISKRI